MGARWWGLGLLALGACTPPCEQVCRKLLFDCELSTQRVALDECTDACARQDSLYASWSDPEPLDHFREHRRCVASASCEELEAGECFDGFEDLFAFDPDKDLPVSTISEPTAGADTGP